MRDRAQRKRDALAMLERSGADVWVASASADGAPYLVPLSLGWDGGRIIVATPSRSPTARNVMRSRTARIALGETRDVVMVDADLDETVEVGQAPVAFADAYSEQAGWDPRTAGEGMVFLAFTPRRIQAWREADEIEGRDIMGDGRWLT